MSSVISAIGTSNPVNKFAQSQILDFMLTAHQLSGDNARRLQKLYQASGIHFRHSVITDFDKQPSKFNFFGNDAFLEPFPSTAQRGQLYQQTAIGICLVAIQNAIQKLPNFDVRTITHVITVSCTGMYAPGLDIEIVEQLNLNPWVERTCINFMGCYGAFNALKMADYICKAQPNATVLVLSVELCTLHFQKENTLDNWLSNSLFADGAAAVVVQHKDFASQKLFNIKGFYSQLVSKARNQMAWTIGNHGYQMQLSNQVAKQIKAEIKNVAQTLLNKLGLALADIGQYAIHPGGRRILEVCDEVFELQPHQNQHAYKVLRDYGNMSSASILFVLDELSNALPLQNKSENVLSFAFGPGLTFESMLLGMG
jgi:predicted naringenin-chalcone synthase